MIKPAGRYVAIIGAGAVGVISAIEALREGHRVTLIDPGEPGGTQAASYGNAGWLSSHSVIPPAEPGTWKKVPAYLMDPLGPLAIRWSYLPKALPWLIKYLLASWTEAQVETTARALRDLLKDAPLLHKQLAEEAGVPELIERRGVMHVFPSRAPFDGDLGWRIRKRVGIEWLELSADEMRQREPDLDPRYKFGVVVEEAGRCRDPGSYVAALANHALASGAELVRTKATGLKLNGNRLVAVTTETGEVACDAAVVAAGARSKQLTASIGDPLPLETERGYHVMIENPEAGPRSSMMASEAKMVVNWTDKGLRAAGTVEIAGLDAAPNWQRAEILRDHLLSMFPKLPKNIPPSRIKTWFGHRPSMPDGRPCIGYARATRDVVYAFGHGHVGLVGSARTGRLVAQLLSGKEPEIPLFAVRADPLPLRFQTMTDPANSSSRIARGGKALYGAPLGILMLEARFPRIPGDMGNGTTWPFPVLYRVVSGATPEKVIKGASGLLPDFIDAAKDLVRLGAEAITTNCGFLSLFQREIAACVGVPVATSSLMQVPWVQATLPPGKRVGLVTVSGSTLSPAHLEGAGVPLDTPLVGTENGKEFFRVLIRAEKDDMDVAQAERDVVEAGKELVARYPEVGAIVLECTNMPPYAAAMQVEVGLPVYDIYSMITWFHAGLRPRVFG